MGVLPLPDEYLLFDTYVHGSSFMLALLLTCCIFAVHVQEEEESFHR